MPHPLPADLLQVVDMDGRIHPAASADHAAAYLSGFVENYGYLPLVDLPLAAGQTRHGVVAFTVPDTARGLHLGFRNGPAPIELR